MTNYRLADGGRIRQIFVRHLPRLRGVVRKTRARIGADLLSIAAIPAVFSFIRKNSLKILGVSYESEHFGVSVLIRVNQKMVLVEELGTGPCDVRETPHFEAVCSFQNGGTVCTNYLKYFQQKHQYSPAAAEARLDRFRDLHEKYTQTELVFKPFGTCLSNSKILARDGFHRLAILAAERPQEPVFVQLSLRFQMRGSW